MKKKVVKKLLALSLAAVMPLTSVNLSIVFAEEASEAAVDVNAASSEKTFEDSIDAGSSMQDSESEENAEEQNESKELEDASDSQLSRVSEDAESKALYDEGSTEEQTFEDSDRIVLLTGTCGDDLNFTLYGDGELDITGSGEMTSSPWKTEFLGMVWKVKIGDGATSIDYQAFRGCSNLTSVELADTITEIEPYAFYGTKITQVKLPSGLEKMGVGAFGDCDGLTGIHIPKKFNNSYQGYSTDYSIGPFKESDNLTQVTFEEGITKIAYGLFANMPALESITIPDTVTTIESKAFSNCAKLKNINFGEGLTEIQQWAFEECPSIEKLDLPDSVTTILPYAFYNAKNLSELHLPSGLKKIDVGAFGNCDSLTSVKLPKSITESSQGYSTDYSSGPFKECDNLTEITFEDGITQIAERLLANTVIDHITIPDTVTSIGYLTFSGTKNLKSITLPESLQTIGNRAFLESGLTEIEIPDSVMKVEEAAFENCKDLVTVDWSKSADTIDDRTFYGDTALKTISIPEGVTTIDSYTFNGCTALEDIVFPDTLDTINDYAFTDCDSLTKLDLPKSLKIISWSAFEDCDGLRSATIPDSVSLMRYSAFKDCDALKEVKLGSGITYLDSSVFEHCASLESIVIPRRVTRIGDNAFKNCVALKSVTIPKSVTQIGNSVFSYPARMTIYGISGIYAEQYAKENDIVFVNSEISAERISLSETSLTLAKGAEKTLFLTIEPDGVLEDVTWRSSNTNVASVDDTGLVRAVGLGTTTIKVTVGNKSVSCKVTVAQPVTYINLNADKCEMEALDTFQLTANVGPEEAEKKDVSWKSSDETVATVDENGLVTAIKKGTAVITAEAEGENGLTAECAVTVTNSSYTVTSVSDLGSSHPYENNCSDSWIYTLKNAASIDVTFDSKTNIEEDFDYLYLYDKDGEEVGMYTGTELAGKTIHIKGDTVRIKLLSDNAGSEWGFKVTSVADPDQKPVVTNPFTDVKKSDYYYDAVLWAVENGITGGVTAETFGPKQECTRAQVVMFLWRAAGKPEPKTTTNPFTDVKSSSPFYKAIMWAVENGITSGSTKTTFSPNATCTRQQIAMFLWRYTGKPSHSVTKNPFTDVKSSGTYYNAIMWAVEKGISSGKTATTFLPTEKCTRAQIVTFLYRMEKLG